MDSRINYTYGCPELAYLSIVSRIWWNQTLANTSNQKHSRNWRFQVTYYPKRKTAYFFGEIKKNEEIEYLLGLAVSTMVTIVPSLAASIFSTLLVLCHFCSKQLKNHSYLYCKWPYYHSGITSPNSRKTCLHFVEESFDPVFECLLCYSEWLFMKKWYHLRSAFKSLFQVDGYSRLSLLANWYANSLNSSISRPYNNNNKVFFLNYNKNL